jgi:DNA-binding MarR family transcriptional regulator
MMEVSLTRFGAREADRIEKANEKTERLLDCLSEEERARLSELLDKLLAK